MDLLIAVLLGVIASLLAWFVVAHSLRPKLDVSPFVSRSVGLNDEIHYRIKIMNARRTRNLVDVRTDAYLWIPGFWPSRPGNNNVVDVPTTSDELIGMRPGDNRILRFDTEAVSVALTDHLNSQAIGSGSLEAMLSLGERSAAELRVWIAYTDAYSGVRRASLHRYTSDQIEMSLFAPTSVGRGRDSLPNSPTPGHATGAV